MKSSINPILQMRIERLKKVQRFVNDILAKYELHLNTSLLTSVLFNYLLGLFLLADASF